MERIPIIENREDGGNGREVSHLAVRFDPTPAGPASRPCFLYLHGFGSEQSGEKAEFFRRRALAAGFGFCSFDFQGHGLSGGEMAALTLTRNLEDVARVHAFLRERGHGRLILIGSSMGGGTALWYSALHPEEIVAGLHIAPALVSWKSVLDFAVRCTFQEIDLHLFADGDHRLTDRKERLWELMEEFLRGRALV
jgi:pimeloyl-ACP methyl ester carboxylesterase